MSALSGNSNLLNPDAIPPDTANGSVSQWTVLGDSEPAAIQKPASMYETNDEQDTAELGKAATRIQAAYRQALLPSA